MLAMNTHTLKNWLLQNVGGGRTDSSVEYLRVTVLTGVKPWLWSYCTCYRVEAYGTRHRRLLRSWNRLNISWMMTWSSRIQRCVLVSIY